MRRIAAVGLVILIALPAAAQTPEDRAMATALFNDGLRLADQGRFDQACPKLEAAKRHLPSFPIQYALAQCWENLGRTADAWQEYRAAAATAAKSGDARGKQALERAARLEPSLAHLTIKLAAGAALPGLEIRLDGTAIDPALSGVPIALNPGTHLVAASAPGRTPWSASVALAARNLEVEVPILTEISRPEVVVEPPEPRPVAASPPAPPAGGSRRTSALIVGGAGLAALGIGVAMGFIAKSHYDDANDRYCHSQLTCDDQMGANAVNDAKGLGTAGSIVAGIGLAAAATGVILYLTAPAEPRPSLSLAVTPGFIGLDLIGGF